MQQVELIAVQRFFNRIDNHVHLVVGKELGNLVALSHRPPVTLGEVGWSPRRIKMMERNRPFLRVHARSEHTRRAEQHPHLTFVHGIYHRLASLVGLALLNETYLACRNTVVLNQLAFNFAVHAPFSRLIRPQIREYELCAFLCVILFIVFRNLGGTVARLVVRVVVVLVRINHAHIECHLTGVIGGYQHLRLFFRFRQGLPA